MQPFFFETVRIRFGKITRITSFPVAENKNTRLSTGIPAYEYENCS